MYVCGDGRSRGEEDEAPHRRGLLPLSEPASNVVTGRGGSDHVSSRTATICKALMGG